MKSLNKLNKKGVELSINFVVTLILTMVVFGSSMFIATKVLNEANILKDQLSDNIERKLESMMSGDEEVVIAFDQKTVKPGKDIYYGIGIYNSFGRLSNFKILVTPNKAFRKDGTEVTNPINEHWGNKWEFFSEIEVGDIANNAYKTKSIGFIVDKDAIKGTTYVFNVEVKMDDYSNGVLKAYPISDSIRQIKIIID